MKNTEAVTRAESNYLAIINKTFSYVLLAHVLLSTAFAYFFDTSISFAIIGSLAICSMPVGLRVFTKAHKLTALVHGISLMFFSGLLIHLSKGMIETHFHIFVSLAGLILYAQPMVILAATLTIAVHHIAFYFLLPASVFNYTASFGIVAIHAVYVIVETIPCMWISNKFNGYIIRQDVIVEGIKDIFTDMNHTIIELNKSNDVISSGTSLQTESVTNTAEAIHEINLMSDTTSMNANESKSISEQTKRFAEEGMASMGELTEAFHNIKSSNTQLFDQMDYYNQQLSEIVTSIKQIEMKTQVINDIVFQTKLLSFNASVEAARAGDQGKGFAVVAEEVGNLASMSGNASKEINELINSSVKRVESIADMTKQKVIEISSTTKKCIEVGEIRTTNTSNRFNELTENLKVLNTKVVEIYNASHEQTVGINRITKAIKDLESLNAKSLEAQNSSTEVSQHLSELSDSMGELVKELHTNKKSA